VVRVRQKPHLAANPLIHYRRTALGRAPDGAWSTGNWPTKIERDVIERALTLDLLPKAAIWSWSAAMAWPKR
jgi:hypothetical protein